MSKLPYERREKRAPGQLEGAEVLHHRLGVGGPAPLHVLALQRVPNVDDLPDGEAVPGRVRRREKEGAREREERTRGGGYIEKDRMREREWVRAGGDDRESEKQTT